MTLNEMLTVLWRRKWLMLSIVVVTMIIAFLLVQRQETTYYSEAVVRSNATVAEAAGSGYLADVPVELDPFVLLSDGALEERVQSSTSEPGVTAESVEVEPDEVYGNQRLYVTVVASSAGDAQQLANAYAGAFVAQVDQEVARAIEVLTAQRDTALAEAQDLQADAAEDPEDVILASRLADALGRYTGARDAMRELDSAGAPASIQVTAQAGTVTGASSTTILAVALFSAILAAVGAALIRDQFDYRLRGDAEAERLTGLPVIGALTLDRGVRRTQDTLPVTRTQATALAEGLRSTRAALQVLLPKEHAVLVLTSVEPGDGKSFTSANIALAWARAGKRVILVGGDLRRPSLETYFGAAAMGPGLVELLQEGQASNSSPAKSSVEARLKDTDFRGLRVLPSGSPPADPADLLANSSVGDVIRSLRGLADVVIIDSPPSLRLVDASLLAEHADGVAVIAWEGRTDRTHLVDTVESLALNEANVLGIVINGTKRRHPRSYTPYYVKSTSRSGATHPLRRTWWRRGDDSADAIDALVKEAPPARAEDPRRAASPGDAEHTPRR